MRLDKNQLKALKHALKEVDGEVFLFGSRVDDDKRGGDIDILVFSENNPFKLSRQISIDFFSECEEKIDVVVMNPNSLTKEQQAFLNIIKREKIQ